MPKVNVSGASIDQLKQELSGYVLQPGTPAYASAVQIDNGRVQQQPTIIVQASGERDVVTALHFAQKEGLRLTVLGGGHSATIRRCGESQNLCPWHHLGDDHAFHSRP